MICLGFGIIGGIATFNLKSAKMYESIPLSRVTLSLHCYVVSNDVPFI